MMVATAEHQPAAGDAPPVTFDRDRLTVHFDRFDIPSYRLFLQVKALPESDTVYHPRTESYMVSAPARFAALLGVQRPAVRDEHPLLAALFEDQAELTAQALDAKRFALWCLCGWGKTPVGLEFGRQASLRTATAENPSGGRALVVTTNDLVPQWLDEAAKFYGDTLPIYRVRSRDDLKRWCKSGEVRVTNCETCGRQCKPVYAGDGEQVVCSFCHTNGKERRLTEHLVVVPNPSVVRPRLAITNYEKFNPESADTSAQVINELRHLVCIILDEASRLRNSGGKQKWTLIKSCRGIEYKLLLTATPAPNDLMEFASQAAFLEKMRSEGDIIWTFFTRDQKTHRWTVKPHARAAFFAFMANWSVYVNDPKRYGWRLDHPDIPAPDIQVVDVPATPEQLAELPTALATATGPTKGQMSLLPPEETEANAIQRVRLSEIAKGFVYEAGGKAGSRKARRLSSHKPATVADIVKRELRSGVQVLVWTLFDEETAILGEHLAGLHLTRVETLTGKVAAKDRPAMIGRFKSGHTRGLVTRAKMLGYGMNLQMCGAMVFSGFSDSFEDMFQAVRRAVRHGQTKAVRVYFPVVRELEGHTWENIQRKQREFVAGIEAMEENYIRARERLSLVGNREVIAA